MPEFVEHSQWLSDKEFTFQAGDTGHPGLSPGLRRFPEGGHCNPLEHSCLENPMDRGGWQATVHGVTKSRNWRGHAGCLASCLQLVPSLSPTPTPTYTPDKFFGLLELILNASEREAVNRTEEMKTTGNDSGSALNTQEGWDHVFLFIALYPP